MIAQAARSRVRVMLTCPFRWSSRIGYCWRIPIRLRASRTAWSTSPQGETSPNQFENRHTLIAAAASPCTGSDAGQSHGRLATASPRSPHAQRDPPSLRCLLAEPAPLAAPHAVPAVVVARRRHTITLVRRWAGARRGSGSTLCRAVCGPLLEVLVCGLVHGGVLSEGPGRVPARRCCVPCGAGTGGTGS